MYQYLTVGIAILGLLLYFAWDIYKSLSPHYLKVYIAYSSLDIRKATKKIKVESGVETIIVNKEKYVVDNSRMYRTGLFRCPTSFYVAGCAEPISLLNFKELSKVSSIDYHEATENHVVSQVIKAFKENFIPQDVGFSLIFIVMAAGFAGLYYMLNKKLDLIVEMLAK